MHEADDGSPRHEPPGRHGGRLHGRHDSAARSSLGGQRTCGGRHDRRLVREHRQGIDFLGVTHLAQCTRRSRPLHAADPVKWG
jgi:hypothetical protein